MVWTAVLRGWRHPNCWSPPTLLPPPPPRYCPRPHFWTPPPSPSAPRCTPLPVATFEQAIAKNTQFSQFFFKLFENSSFFVLSAVGVKEPPLWFYNRLMHCFKWQCNGFNILTSRISTIFTKLEIFNFLFILNYSHFSRRRARKRP